MSRVVGFLMRLSRFSFLLVAALLILAIQPSVHAAVGISITPGSQVVSQFGATTFAINLLTPMYPSPYALALSGSVTGFPFSPNPIPTPPIPSTLTIDLSSSLVCPGTYPFTVVATNVPPPGPPGPVDTVSGTASLTVVQAGPPLQVSISSDKPAYMTGDTVTISLSVTRLAEGQVRVTGPSGFSPRTYPFQTTTIGPSSGVVGTFTAGQPFGTYTATAVADDFCGFSSSASATFTVAPDTYPVTVSLSGVPSQYSAMIQVDGQNQGSIAGSQPKTLGFKVNTSHTITVDQYVAGNTGVRYYASQNSWAVSSTDSHTFTYQTQYQFSVSTDPSGVVPTTGGGWYNDGTSVQTNQAPQTVAGSSGTQYAFKGWELDGSAQSGNQLSATMNMPHTAVAKYSTQYQLVIDSPGGIGNPQGAGYYDAGSSATFSVTSPVGFLVQQVFVQWQGDYTGTNPQGAVTMDKPNTVHAVWTTSYTQAYIAAGILVVAVIAAAILMMRRRKGGTKAAKPTKKKGFGLRIGGKPKPED